MYIYVLIYVGGALQDVLFIDFTKNYFIDLREPMKMY